MEWTLYLRLLAVQNRLLFIQIDIQTKISLHLRSWAVKIRLITPEFVFQPSLHDMDSTHQFAQQDEEAASFLQAPEETRSGSDMNLLRIQSILSIDNLLHLPELTKFVDVLECALIVLGLQIFETY